MHPSGHGIARASLLSSLLRSLAPQVSCLGINKSSSCLASFQGAQDISHRSFLRPHFGFLLTLHSRWSFCCDLRPNCCQLSQSGERSGGGVQIADMRRSLLLLHRALRGFGDSNSYRGDFLSDHPLFLSRLSLGVPMASVLFAVAPLSRGGGRMILFSDWRLYRSIACGAPQGTDSLDALCTDTPPAREVKC
jgi:hypothetical protein